MKKAFVPLLFSLVLQSCIFSSAITPQEHEQIVENARFFAMENIELNDREKSKLEKKPQLGYYFVTSKSGQFVITWPLDSKRKLVVRGWGDVTKASSLEGVLITDIED